MEQPSRVNRRRRLPKRLFGRLKPVVNFAKLLEEIQIFDVLNQTLFDDLLFTLTPAFIYLFIFIYALIITFLIIHSHLCGFYWGRQCSWAHTPANSMQASNRQSFNCNRKKPSHALTYFTITCFEGYLILDIWVIRPKSF